MSDDSDSAYSIALHNRTICNNLKPGDLIQFVRRFYSHWAVYIGNGMVVHLAGEDNDGLNGNKRPEYLFSISGKTFDKAKVCMDELSKVIEGCKIYVNNSKDEKLSPLTPEQIVKNATSRIGSVGYSIITKNCEHFAKWCRYGVEQSDQVDTVLTGAAVGTAIVATAGLAYTLFSPNKARREDDN